MVARRPLVPVLGLGLPVAWRSRTWSEPDTLRLRFVHLGGATNGMDVTWRIEPPGRGCRVSIDHDFRPRVPGWAAFVDRAFTRPIASRTLATFKAIAEALVDDESDRPPRAAKSSSMSSDRTRVWITGIGVITAAGTGVAGFRAGLRAGAVAGQADRPVRPVAVPLAGRRPGRRLRPARLDAAEDRPPARSVQPVRARRPGSWPSRTPRCGPARAARRRRSGSGSISAARSAASPTPRSSTSGTWRRASARSPRTSPWRSSAARRRPTSGSPSTSAGRSSRRRTRARRAPSRSARRSGAIRAGEIDAAIAGGVEIPLSPLAFGAFDIIRALSSGSNDDPAHACRPFDARRDGFVMGEGAALLVLESDEVVRARGAEPYAEVMGYGATSDAYHMVQPRADGREAARAATIALADAGVAPDEIDYVSAHASSTPIGDVAEARAIALALGERAATVPVSGTKALYGHPLGASGAIEAAICALAIRDGWAPASVNLAEPDPDVAAILPCLLREGREGEYRRILSTSFGFGGLNAALVFGADGAA